MLKSSNKTYTVAEATKRMERYCIYQERCYQEIERKLSEMRLISEAKDLITLHLIENDFLNEARFASAFARGKFKIKKWGKQRLIRALNAKRISKYNIDLALKEIDEIEYENTFHELAEKRVQYIQETNIYKKRKKLADFLIYRGWESDLVYKKIEELIR